MHKIRLYIFFQKKKKKKKKKCVPTLPKIVRPIYFFYLAIFKAQNILSRPSVSFDG